ncbi:hypothetical protein P608_04560 [Comamonas thiooxydans]|uniref:Uncharacterized protein n=2 Tax=Comamonas TaxID=283 RepID=A0A0E3BF20_9BURK|nr:hypothetical protein O987_22012 [Comamonas testosteroni TK102]KGG85545.1 hypothetical protein P245_22770 [Comamonas thiooxydans]KGH19240.1 hypothetical protein P608_04560 [Comamonas thiooxydans]KGH26116.1 hypothetical protein P607_04905 [Comamonas thiooxydans]KGH27169.1 hypothetical protein P606_04280 [Comamonas thiooxydans]
MGLLRQCLQEVREREHPPPIFVQPCKVSLHYPEQGHNPESVQLAPVGELHSDALQHNSILDTPRV